MRKVTSFLLALLLFVSVSGCGQSSPEPNSNLEDLAATEIKEYQGQDLSSILDFRENSIDGPQYIDIETYTLTVDGLVEDPTSYTYQQALDYPHYQKLITLHCVEGWQVTILWEGILLSDIFDDVVVQEGANTVIFHSYDGYSTSLPLETILDRDIMIAYMMNGVTLPPERGFPFQLVAEDKLGYKWAKWITRIELSNDTAYEGYWEQRGFGNDADVEKN